MIRISKLKYVDGALGELKYIEASGLSTDTKPVDDIVTGSLFLEVDTGNIYAYDEDGETWHGICELGGVEDDGTSNLATSLNAPLSIDRGLFNAVNVPDLDESDVPVLEIPDATEEVEEPEEDPVYINPPVEVGEER